MEMQIGNRRAKYLINSRAELNFIKESVAL